MKVALYARVSTDKQTTDNQIIRLREWADRKQWEVYAEYIDVRSGKDANRPQLKEMLSCARKGYFDCILAVRLDRIGRSVMQLSEIVENLDRWQVGLKLLDQDIDTTTVMGKFMFTILSAAAEFERNLIVDRVNDGLDRARKEGKTLGRPTRKLSKYQIEKAKSILAENPNISNRKLAEKFDGISMNTLIKELRALGILEKGVQKTGSGGVYKEGPETEGTQGTSDCCTDSGAVE